MKSNRSVTPLSVLCGQKPLFHVMSLNHLKACLVFVLALLPATLAAIEKKAPLASALAAERLAPRLGLSVEELTEEDE